MYPVRIRGQGVAAHSCAKLLTAAGFAVALEDTERARLPAILLGGTTQTLLRDIFGEPHWLGGLPRIEKRVVAWGPHAEPVTLPHFAVVISEQSLCDRLRPEFPADHDCEERASWRFLASRPLPGESREHSFGSRQAVATAVELKEDTDRTACCIESLESGWLFLIPAGAEGAWLLSVGNGPQSLLAESRLIADRIRATGRSSAEFPAYPRIADPLCGPGWLSGGTAALAFDPLCGDGTGHALREAILASAVIRAVARGLDTGELLAHYRGRLLAAFQRHLEVCRGFYSTGGNGEWWAHELFLIERGIEWCRGEAAGAAGFRFQLNGFELQRVW